MSETPQKTSISKGTYHLFIGNLVSTIVLAIASIIVGRLLGPNRFGLYTIALIVPSYAYLVLRLGSTSTITRYAAKYVSEGNEKKAISFSYTISILHLALGLLVVGLLIPFTNVISTNLLHRPELASGIIIPIALLSVVGQIVFYNGTGAFVGLHSFGKAAVFQVINAVAKLALSVLLLLLGYSVLGAVAGYTFGFILAGVISLVLLISLNKRAIPKNIKADVGMSADYAWPIFFSILLAGLVAPFQSTILAYTVSNTVIGWYSAASNIVGLIVLFTYPVTTVLLPLFSKTVAGGTKQLAETYRLSVKYTALTVTPVTLFVMALSTPLASAIYGHAYESSGNYLLILAVISLLAGLGGISWNAFLYGVSETRKALLATAAGSVVSIVVSIILVFYAGVYGVIIGTIIGQIVSLFIGARFVSDILGAELQTWSVWRIYLSSALSAMFVYLVSLIIFNQFLAVIVGVAFFLLILFPIMAWTKALTRNDMSALQEQFKDVRLMSVLLTLISKYHSLFAKVAPE
jgi:O-antigen/teichoic acid export membrane protein